MHGHAVLDRGTPSLHGMSSSPPNNSGRTDWLSALVCSPWLPGGHEAIGATSAGD